MPSRSLFAGLLLALSISAPALPVAVSAQDARAAQEAREARDDGAKSISGKVTDTEKNPLALAEVILLEKCSCKPCRERNVSCAECCPPGRSDATVVATRADASGDYRLALPSDIKPGEYSLQVISGKFSRNIELEVDEKQRIKFERSVGLKSNNSETNAMATIPLATKF